MNFAVPSDLENQINELVTHYPQKRSASLMVLHALQERFGCITPEAMEWTARKLGMQPIHVLELVTFYPMFRQEPLGKFHIKICRTLSCSLGGAYSLREFFCQKLGMDAHVHGPQTSKDGRFTVEFVECLASCGTAPVVMLNDELFEKVTPQKAEEILAQCK
jgi:NADH-quinone oxidoreductase subunit E